MQHFWPSRNFQALYPQLAVNPSGWLVPTDDYWRLFLQRPELALVPESCPAEQALHAALLAEPSRPFLISALPAALAAVQDPDARDSYALFLRFQAGVQAAGTLEAYYLSRLAEPPPGEQRDLIPPLFIDWLVQAIARQVLDDSGDAFELRAAEMLFQSQRISSTDGQVLSGDLATLDMLNETGGLGDMGRFLAEAQAPMRSLDLQVLSEANAVDYWQQRGQYSFLLDLTHEVTHDLSHGLLFKMTRARSGLKALASVLQRWVRHFLGVAVRITPLQKIDDAAWRWHIGLDAQASALLNDLYDGRAVEPERLQRLISLFRLDFEDPQDMRPDVAGKPIYLGLMRTADGVVRLKPQNLLVNLPLRKMV